MFSIVYGKYDLIIGRRGPATGGTGAGRPRGVASGRPARGGPARGVMSAGRVRQPG